MYCYELEGRPANVVRGGPGADGRLMQADCTDSGERESDCVVGSVRRDAALLAFYISQDGAFKAWLCEMGEGV